MISSDKHHVAPEIIVPDLLGDRSIFFGEHLDELDALLEEEHTNNIHCRFPGGMNRSGLLNPNARPIDNVPDEKDPQDHYRWNSMRRIMQSRGEFHALIDEAIRATEIRHGMPFENVEKLSIAANDSEDRRRGAQARIELFPVKKEVIRLLMQDGYTFYDAAQ